MARVWRASLLVLLMLAGCDASPPDRAVAPSPESVTPSNPPAAPQSLAWTVRQDGKGITLRLGLVDGAPVVVLACPTGTGNLLVNVPAFTPIGSEERLSFGSNGAVEALVADVRGDPQLGGVTGTGRVPDNLAALVAGPIAISYGAQSSGPHQALPAEMARTFVASCLPRASRKVSACHLQDEAELKILPLRAMGTEPFWGARIDGRCVTYSHPYNIAGTRIWTRFTQTADGGVWSGAPEGKRFELRTHAAPGCSDGMSDKRYPFAAELTLGKDVRNGCAERL